MTRLALICGLERLWPNYEDDHWYFSLQLSAALLEGEGGETNRDLLELWEWSIEDIKVWIGDENSATEVTATRVPCDHEAKARIVELLKDQFKKSVPPTPAALLWQPELGPEHEFESERLARNVLAYFSTLPTPIPQVANLSLVFKIPAQDETVLGKKLVAAPVVKTPKISDEEEQPLRTPDDPSSIPDPDPETRGHFEWAYPTVAGKPGLTAFLLPWTIIEDAKDEPVKSSQIELGTLLAAKPAAASVLTSEDWLSRLIQRGADGFDLAARTIEALRTVEEDEELQKPENQDQRDALLEALVQATLDLLRDRAHSGHLRGPDGDRLVDDLLERCGFEEDGGAVERGLAASVAAALNAYEFEQLSAEESRRQRWQKLLRDEVPAQSFPSEIVQQDGTIVVEGATDMAARLGQLHLALQDDDVLQRLLWRQWEEAVDLSRRITTGQETREFYTVVNTDVVNTKLPSHGKQLHRGDIALAPGETQVLTLAEIEHRFKDGIGQVFRFVCRPGSLEEGALPDKDFGLRVETTETKIELACQVAGTEVHTASLDKSETYHLRLVVQHDGLADPKTAKFKLTFQFALKGAERFDDLITVDLELPIVETRYCRLVVEHQSGPELAFTLPTALSVRGDLSDVLEEWDGGAFHKPGVVWQTCSGLLRDRVLPEVDLRAIHGRTVLAPVVTELASIEAKPEKVRTKLEELYRDSFLKYLRQRLESAAGPSVYNAYLPRLTLTGDSKSRVEKRIEAFAPPFVRDRLFPESTALEDASPTEVPHAVSLPVDHSQGFEEDNLNEAIDIQRKIQGVAVFLRAFMRDGEEWKPKPWRCLNVARPLVPEDDAVPRDISGLKQVLVPCRLAYQNDLRQALVTYDNHPLTAGSFAVGIGDGAMAAVSEVGADETPMLAFEQLEGSKHGWAILPGLVFGRKYQAFVAAVGPGGALPKQLSNGHPAKLRGFDESFDPDLPAKYRHDFFYRRRVRVGSPRIQPQERDEREDRDPKIVTHLPTYDPETVTPLWSEISELKPSPEAKDRDRALLLLAPAEDSWQHPHTYTFDLRPPAADLQTWDRWVANDPNGEIKSGHRIQVWTAFHDPARQEKRGVSRSKADRALDDPAVTAFYVELEQLGGDGPSQAKLIEIEREIPDPDPAVASMKAAQVEPIPARIRVGDSPSLEADSKKIEVLIPKGQIWELRLFPAVLKKYFFECDEGRRFIPKSVAIEEGAIKRGDYLLFTPSRLVIETAIDTLPDSESLWRAMVPRFDGARAILELDPEAAGDERMIWIKDLTSSRQLWRFTGRPLEAFPFGALPEDGVETETEETDLAKIHRWEVQGFGDRPDDDRLFWSSEALFEQITTLFEEDLSGDLRARLYRFQLTASSRYRGLRQNPNDLQKRARRGGDNGPFWRRLLVPSRVPETEIPPPAVKLVLPLTEAAGENTVPPLMVVLNEPWYQVGGLNEFLEVEIEEVKDPDGVERQQVGFDPILRGAAWQTGHTVRFSADRLFGQTFDTDTDAPRFVNTSVLLEAGDTDGASLDWTFAKLRFTRLLKGAGDVSGEDHASPSTASHWVQLLRDGSRFRIGDSEETIGVEELRLGRGGADGSALELWIEKKESGDKVELKPRVKVDHGSKAVHELWVLVLEVIRDAADQRDLRYYGLYRWVDGKLERDPSEPERVDRPDELTAWVIETQRRDGARDDPAARLWERLFSRSVDDATPEDDAAIRIVHISRPIVGVASKPLSS